MNLFQKVKALWTIKTVVEEEIKEAKAMNALKAGWKTSEFWLHLAVQAGVLWAAVKGFVPEHSAVIIQIAGIAIYTIARTVLKAVSDIKGTVVVEAPVV